MSYPCCSIKPHMISKCYALLLYRRQLLYFLTLSNCRLLYNFLAPNSASAITESIWNKLSLYQIISLILCWTLSFSKSVTKHSRVVLILFFFFFLVGRQQNILVVSWCCGRVQTPNDVIQKIGKILNNAHTTKQKRTNNGFRNIQKNPTFSPLSLSIARSWFYLLTLYVSKWIGDTKI